MDKILDLNAPARRALRRIANAGQDGITTEELGFADAYSAGLLTAWNLTTTEFRPTEWHLIRITAAGRELLAQLAKEENEETE